MAAFAFIPWSATYPPTFAAGRSSQTVFEWRMAYSTSLLMNGRQSFRPGDSTSTWRRTDWISGSRPMPLVSPTRLRRFGQAGKHTGSMIGMNRNSTRPTASCDSRRKIFISCWIVAAHSCYRSQAPSFASTIQHLTEHLQVKVTQVNPWAFRNDQLEVPRQERIAILATAISQVLER